MGIVDPVVAIVVVDEETLDAERTVVADPFFDIERFVLDDRGDAKVEFLILRVDSSCVGNATTRDSDKIFFARYLFVKRVRVPEFHKHDAADSIQIKAYGHRDETCAAYDGVCTCPARVSATPLVKCCS